MLSALEVRRFAQLPYVAAALYDHFVAVTGFVQYRDGRVPRVRTSEIVRASDGARIHAALAICSLFSGAWSAPETTLERRLGPIDIAAIVDCATRLSAIPT